MSTTASDAGSPGGPNQPNQPDESDRPVGGTAARRARQDARTHRGTGAPSSAPARRPTRRELDPDALAILEEERDFLLRSLRDLDREHDAGDLDDVDYETLKDDYTARAAVALRAIEARQAALSAAQGPRRPGRSLAWVAAVVVFAVVAGYLFAQSSGRRGAGDSVSGDIRQTVRDQLMEAQSLMGQNPVEAIKRYDEVIQQSPANAEAHTYKGWLLYTTSRQITDAAQRNEMVAVGLASLSKAIELEPDYPDARVFRAILYRGLGQPQGALDDLNRVQNDQVPEFMRPQVDSLRKSLAGTSGPTSVPSAPPSETPAPETPVQSTVPGK